MTITPSHAMPGTFVLLEDPSIVRTGPEDFNVTISDSSGTAVTIRSLFVEAGRARIPVPPILDDETGDIATGEVTIAIPGGKQTTFTIDALPELDELSAGYVVEAFPTSVRDNLYTHLDRLVEFDTDFGYDTAAMQIEVLYQIVEIESGLVDLATLGTLSNPSDAFGSTRLSEQELRQMDRGASPAADQLST